MSPPSVEIEEIEETNESGKSLKLSPWLANPHPGAQKIGYHHAIMFVSPATSPSHQPPPLPRLTRPSLPRLTLAFALGLVSLLTLNLAHANPPAPVPFEADMRGWVPGDPLPVSPGPRPGETSIDKSPGLRRLRPQPSFLPGVGQYPGALAGKTIYLSPGHGWTYTSSAGWSTQRGKSQGLVEDMSNTDGVRQFLIPYLWGAGAQIIPVRELDQQTAMVILDNSDGTTSPQRGRYEESGDASLFQDSTLAAWGHPKLPLQGKVNPFALGGNRLMKTAASETARATFVMNVPRAGYYFVYVSYSMYSARPSDARYTVIHPGGRTTYLLDQRRHGGTWVLLGRHYFDAGMDAKRGAIVISNQSADADTWLSIDAVRLGGGRGLIDRGGGTSGHPRADENARYHAQFCGAPSSVYDNSTGSDRTDDVSSRSLFADWLHADGEDAIYLSHHSNAFNQKTRGTETYIYGHNPPNGTYAPDSRVLALGADKLAKAIHNQVISDIRATIDPTWKDRHVKSAYFGELNPSRQDEMPAALIELAFHDNAEDAAYLKDPHFRRVTARAIYKGIVKYFAQKDGSPVHFLPEPPTRLVARNSGPGRVTVTWAPPPTGGVLGDPATSYRVYFSHNGYAFDEGTATGGKTSWTFKNLKAHEVIFIRVCATNEGGESLPSPTLAVGVAEAGHATPLLLVGGFDRFDAGLDLLIDYTKFTQIYRLFLDRINDGTLLTTYGRALRGHGIAFDAAWRDGLGVGVDPKTYRAILWAAAKGASKKSAFASEDILALTGAAQAGVGLLISGSTVASSLATSTAPLAKTLLEDDLAARLLQGGETRATVLPAASSGVFGALGSLPLGDTTWRPFPVGPVDTIDATPHGVLTATYGAGGGALVEGNHANKACSLLATFPLAAIADDDRRNAAILHVATHCPLDGGAIPSDAMPLPSDTPAALDGGLVPTDAMPLPDDISPPHDGDGGCDCRVGGPAPTPRALLLLALLALALGRRRPPSR